MAKYIREVTSKGLVKLDKLLEHHSRLRVCVLLADVDAMTFTSLKQLPQGDGRQSRGHTCASWRTPSISACPSALRTASR